MDDRSPEIDQNHIVHSTSISPFGIEYPDIHQWGLDPTFSCYRKMMIWSIHHQIETKIDPRDDLLCHFYYHRPIQKVEITGIIVSLERGSKRNTIIVDDGTSSIRCIKYLRVLNNWEIKNDEWNSSSASLPFPGGAKIPEINIIDALEVGDLVTVKGILEKIELNTSDYELMMKINIIGKQNDPNVEVFQCFRTLQLTQTVYNKPFQYSK